MPIELAPVGVFLLGALIALIAGGRVAPLVALVTPVLSALLATSLLVPGTTAEWSIMDYTLVPVRVDAMALVFVGLFHVAAFLAALYALEVDDRLQSSMLLAYAGAGIGAVLAGDLISLWLFWELLALSSVLLVWAGRTPEATAAGVRYLVFNVTSGVTLLVGIALFGMSTGSFAFDAIGLDAPGGWLILLAFGIKTGFPLLHNWIPDAYPKASLTGTVVLVAVTTKVGIYALARGYAGEQILISIGGVMALWPIFFALVEDDLRRVLAYSLMVQLGLMVAAIGIGSPMALDGVALHVVMDVMFKMLLFMVLGAVWLRTGTVRASELGGLAGQMPWTTAFAAVGVAANAALPLTGAFISKKWILGAAEYAHPSSGLMAVGIGLSALGVLYLGLRVLYQAFFKSPRTRGNVEEAPWPMLAAMGVITATLLITGIAPALITSELPFGSSYQALTASNVIHQLELLSFAVLTYLVLARLGLGIPQSGPATLLDTEWVYRRLLPGMAGGVTALLARWSTDAKTRIRAHIGNPGDGRISAILARGWPTGSMAFWTVVLLAALLSFGIWFET